MDLIIIFSFGIFIFATVNILTFFISKDNNNRKPKIGLSLLLISPVVFYITLEFVSLFDKGGFAASIFAFVYGFLFFVNGLILLWLSA
ncbi:hypothetical protein EI200_04095 [Peribacillus simplex]|uniref:hypothetical protein n=1 Tax=Peribacillus simplex TaxID=1478 RepID=UPI000F63E711|nr:hypothetical protein [Peribacillus simplex]RRN73874.1 hypothetical protein EI200_04095 [Peribacillus simplex]